MSHARRVANPIGLAATMIGLSLVLTGCPQAPPAPKATDGKDATASSAEDSQATDILTSALHQMAPENFEVGSDAKAAISLLNTWYKLKFGETPLPPVPTGTLAFWGKDSQGLLEQATFDLADARLIRDAFLFDRIATHVAGDARTDEERVNRTFFYTMRNVALRDENEDSLPFDAFNVILTGRGTPQDRAEVFIAILRQLRFDAVILAPSAQGTLGADWLVGVLLDQDVLLYDSQLGLPVPADTRCSLDPKQKVARLSEAVQHEEWLKALSPKSDRPYRFSTESLKTLKPFLVCDSRSTSSRFQLLQQGLPAGSTVLLAQSLAGTPESLIPRVEAALPGPDRKPQLWSGLAARQELLGSGSQVQARLMAETLIPFAAPFEVSLDKEKNEFSTSPGRFRQFRTRIAQLQGDYEAAVAAYVTIRQLTAQADRVPLDVNRIHQRAAEDAFFFSGEAKLDEGDNKGAVRLLSEYVGRYRKGRWRSAARLAIATAQFRLKDLVGLRETLEAPLTQDPYRVQVQLLKNALFPSGNTDSNPEPTEAEPVKPQPTKKEVTSQDPSETDAPETAKP